MKYDLIIKNENLGKPFWIIMGIITFIILGFFVKLSAEPKGLPYDKGLYGFKLSDGFYAKRGNGIHGSWDIMIPTNTPIFSNIIGKAKVKKSATNEKAGAFVELVQGDYEVTYCHLSEPRVLTGWEVDFGAPLGYSGATGEATGPHLHYQIRHKGKLVNPQNYI